LTRRRLLHALISLAACVGLFGLASAADSQQAAMPRRIGVLLGGFSPESKEALQFRLGLVNAGYFEGRDVMIEWRPAGGDSARVAELATDLVQHKVEVIVVTSKEAIPRLGRVAVLWNPDTPFHTQVVQDLKAVAPLLAIELSVVGVQRPEEFTPAFSAVRRAHSQALYVIEDTLLFTHRAMLVKVAS